VAWILLVLVAQLTWALGNYLDHYLLVRYRPQVESTSSVGTLVMVSASFTVVTGTLIGLTSLILFRLGAAESNPLDLAPVERLTAMSVGVLEILWLIPYMHALDESDETLAPPLFQTVPVFGLVLGFLFFDEMPPALHILAGACILAGSIGLNTNWWGPRAGDRAIVNVRVIALMMLASFIISLAAFLFKGTALEENYWGTAFWMSIGGLLTGCGMWLSIPSYRRDFNRFMGSRDRRGFALNLVNELTDSAAVLAFYGAVVLGPSTALVQATVAYQPIFILTIGLVAARLGSTFHAERLSGQALVQRSVGILVIVLGSVLIFL
jgi:hypothetical protein